MTRLKKDGLSLLVAATALLPFSASAASGHDLSSVLTVQWQAPTTCPSRDGFLTEVRAHLSRVPEPTQAPLDVWASITRGAAAHYLTLRIRGTERHLHNASCSELTRAGALIVALMLEPGMSPSPPNNPPTNTAPPPAPVVDTPPPEPAQRKQLIQPSVGLSALVDVGTLPEPVVLGVVSVGLDFTRGHIRLRAAAHPGQDNVVNGNRSLRLTPIWAGVVGCGWVVERERTRVGPCLSLDAGVIRTSSGDVAAPREANPAVVTGGGTLALSYAPSPSWALLADAGAALPLVRPRVWFDEPGRSVAVYTAKAALRVGLGFRVNL